jgi:molybdate transport repressor ModE-like protein
MLDLERLRALHAVAEHGSVSAAAEVLHVTTSAVSQQLAKLERETGQKLLERNGRGIRLTDAAELLVRHADRILSMVETAEADLEAHRGAVVGQLTVGAFPTAIRGLAATALPRLRREHPQLRVLVQECDPSDSVPMLLRGRLDVAVVQDWSNSPMSLPEGLARGLLCVDVADVALPAGHPLAGRDSIELKELAGEPWISSTPDSICCEWLTHTLRLTDCEPRIEHMAYEYATQLALVATGLGAGILPRLGRCDVPDGVRVVGLRPLLTRRVFALWRRETARRPAISAIVDALRAAAPEPDPGALAGSLTSR